MIFQGKIEDANVMGIKVILVGPSEASTGPTSQKPILAEAPGGLPELRCLLRTLQEQRKNLKKMVKALEFGVDVESWAVGQKFYRSCRKLSIHRPFCTAFRSCTRLVNIWLWHRSAQTILGCKFRIYGSGLGEYYSLEFHL